MYSLATVAIALSAGIASAAAAKTPWTPVPGTPWQISLSQKIDPNGALDPAILVYDIDLFDNDAATISAFHTKGKKVICYFSAGSSETWRSDYSSFKPADLGSALDGWAGENYVDSRSANVRAIMAARIDTAAQKGCDAIDPDNIDAYGNDNGLGLTKADAVDYLKFMAQHAADQGLSTGLKNAGEMVHDVLPNIHFVVNEQCHSLKECATWQPFITANKAVFNIEYPNNDDAQAASYCSRYTTGSTGFSTLVKNVNLDQYVQVCPILGGSYSSASVAPVSSTAAPTTAKVPTATISSTADASTATAPAAYTSNSVVAPIATTPVASVSSATTLITIPVPSSSSATATQSKTRVIPSNPIKSGTGAPYPTSTSSVGRQSQTSTANAGRPSSTGTIGKHKHRHGHKKQDCDVVYVEVEE